MAEKNAMIGEAYSRLQVMSEDEAARMIYEARLKARRDEYSRIQGALRQGRQEGRQEGRKEERQEVARAFKALDVPPDKIAKATGLSVDEIAAL